MNFLHPVFALIITFFAGSIPTAYLMGRARGIDIRTVGSGNVGATNAFRVLGKGWGIACLLLDMFKGLLPVLVFTHLLHWGPAHWPAGSPLWAWVLGLTAIAGHMFTPFLNFHGGKGVATSLGVVLAITPLPMLIVFITGILIIWRTGYVSVASITGAALLPLLTLWRTWGQSPPISFVITLLLGAMIIWKHRANIQRLRAGTEKRILNKTAKTTGGRA